MIFEVAPAAEVPVLLVFVVGLLALLAAFTSRGLIYVWNYSIGWMFTELGKRLVFRAAGVTINLGGWLIKAAEAVPTYLGRFASQSDHAAARMFHQAALIQRWAVYEIAALSRDTLHLGNYIVHKLVPGQVRFLMKWAVPGYALYRLVTAALDANWPRLFRQALAAVDAGLGATVRTLRHAYTADWEWLKRRRADLAAGLAITVPLAHGLRLPWVGLGDRIGALERMWNAITKRIGRVEALLGVTGMAIALANVLGLPDWRCLTRGPLGRASRAVCGAHSQLLDDLLGLFADFLILENVCVLLPLFEEAVGVVALPVVEALTVVDAGICYGEKPSPMLGVPRLYIPPVAGFVAASLPG